MPKSADGRRGQDSPAWVDVPIDKGSAETDQAAVLVSGLTMQQSTVHSEAESCAAGGGKALAFSEESCSDSDSGDEEERWNENDDATTTWISRLMALQEDARLKQERLDSESNRMIQETHHVWVPPFSNGSLFIALPKTQAHSEALFRVGYEFEFLSVSKASFVRQIQELPHCKRKFYAGTGKGRGLRKLLWLPRTVMAQLMLQHDGPFRLSGRQYGRHFVDYLKRYQIFRRLVLDGYDFGEHDFTPLSCESEYEICDYL